MIELDMEDLIAEYPDDFFPTKGFKLKGRQQSFAEVGRFDLLFEDHFYVQTAKNNQSPWSILVEHASNLNTKIAIAHEETGGMPKFDAAKKKWVTGKDKASAAAQWLCANFYDVRTFGAVLSTGPNAGQIRGPVQLSFARSVNPILPMDIAITRVASPQKSCPAGWTCR